MGKNQTSESDLENLCPWPMVVGSFFHRKVIGLILAQNNVICDKCDKSGMGSLPMDANQIF